MKKTKIKNRLAKFVLLIGIFVSMFMILPSPQVEASAVKISCDKYGQGINTAGNACVPKSGATGCEENQTRRDLKEGGFECVPRPAATPEAEEDLKGTLRIVSILTGTLNFLLWPILILIGMLMDSSLIFGGGMEEVLRGIWIPIRNIVNILFVLILVGIALYNILGIGDENSEYAIKSVLPKIIIGIIAVNFSFLMIKVMLDVVNVLTVSVFAIPMGNVAEIKLEDKAIESVCAGVLWMDRSEYISMTDEKRTAEIKKKAYKTVLGRMSRDKEIDLARVNSATITLGELQVIAGDVASQPPIVNIDEKVEEEEGKMLCNPTRDERTKKIVLSATGEKFLQQWGHRNAALAMAVNMGNITFFEDVLPDSLKTLGTFLKNSLLSMVLMIVFTLSFMAMFVVLLGRLVIIWISVALSPILILVMSSSTIKEKFSGSLGKLVDGFTKNAIAPLVMAIPMTVGWIMTSAIKGGTSLSSEVMDVDSFVSGIPVQGLNSLQDFLVAIATIAIVWVGVFAAAEGTVAQSFTDKIKSFAESAGKYVGGMPFRHLPIIPIKKPDGSMQPVGMGEAFTGLTRRFTQDPYSRGDAEKRMEWLTGKKAVSGADLKRVTDKRGFYNWAKGVSDKELKESSDKLKAWAKDNRSVYQDIRNELGKEDAQRLDKVRDGTATDDDIRQLKANQRIQDATPMAGAPTTAGSATTGGGTSAGPVKTIGPRDNVQVTTAEGRSTRVRLDAASITALNKEVPNLASAIDSGEQTRIRGAILEIRNLDIKDINGDKVYITRKELEERLGENRNVRQKRTSTLRAETEDGEWVNQTLAPPATPPATPPVTPPATPPVTPPASEEEPPAPPPAPTT